MSCGICGGVGVPVLQEHRLAGDPGLRDGRPERLRATWASTRSATPASRSDMGVERIAALKYNVPDLRMLVEGDMRFLRQF